MLSCCCCWCWKCLDFCTNFHTFTALSRFSFSVFLLFFFLLLTKHSAGFSDFLICCIKFIALSIESQSVGRWSYHHVSHLVVEQHQRQPNSKKKMYKISFYSFWYDTWSRWFVVSQNDVLKHYYYFVVSSSSQTFLSTKLSVRKYENSWLGNLLNSTFWSFISIFLLYSRLSPRLPKY